jgi:parallel beta-helix repeat protein
VSAAKIRPSLSAPRWPAIAAALQGPSGTTRNARAAFALFVALAALALPSAALGKPPRVAYLGPATHLAGPIVLRASATAGRNARIVAVTFLLDGKPLGSDTTAPYNLDLDAGLLPDGAHTIRVVAVNHLGRRARTKPVAVRIEGRTGPIIDASPENGLDAALAALRRGGATVRLLPGRYEVHEVTLGTGAQLLGSGPRTVLAPPPGRPYSAILVARGSGIRISDLTVDGGGAGEGDGMAIAVFDGSRDVRLQRLRIERVRTDGVAVWGAHADVSIQDSRIEGDHTARAGVFALGSDASRDTSVIRTRIHAFRGYGILLAQTQHNRPAAALHGLALDNVVSDIVDPTRHDGTNEGGIWSGGVEAAILGNRVRRTGIAGIETVGSSTRTSVVGNDVRQTPVGIYLEHATNRSLFSRNRIARVQIGINVEWRYDGIGSARNTFSRNRIVSARKAGIFVDVGDDRNRIVNNTFVGGFGPAIVLQGTSYNVVRRNRVCGNRKRRLVVVRSGRTASGTLRRPARNLLTRNTFARSCRRR